MSRISELHGYYRGLLKTVVLGAWAQYARYDINRKWHIKRCLAVPHQLPFPLIVSLTSYPPRFPSLSLTLKSLLSQTVSPDHVILWIAERDRHRLPDDVLELTKHGLQVGFCEDIKSYKKIIPTIRSFPEAAIITADDDLFYRDTWLEELVREFRPEFKEVLCHRAHGILLRDDGYPTNYLAWELNIPPRKPSNLIFPTSGSGALYPPKIFHRDVIRRPIFEELCPTGDDIWLYWMASMGGALFRKVGKARPLIMWRGTQEESLFSENSKGENDRQIAKMIRKYGFPPSVASEKMVLCNEL